MTTVPVPKRLKRTMRYAAIRLVLALISRVPLRWAVTLGEGLGRLVFLLARTQRRWALSSLKVAFPTLSEPERRRLAQASFSHLGRCAFELGCIRQLDRRLEEWVDWPPGQREILERAMAKGRGVVFVSGHVGNWELLARRVARAGFPCQSIAKETTDDRLSRMIERFRQSGRVGTIWRGRPGAAKKMLRALRAGEILGLVIDQDTRVQSVFVPFFGRLASTPRAAADLALRTGAAVVTGFCQREPNGRYRLSMRALEVVPSNDYERDVHLLTMALTRDIEEAISRMPAQWVWMHRRWKTEGSPV